MQSDIRVLEAEPFFLDERARTPLKFGAVIIEAMTFCHVRTRVETRAGRRADGWGAIMLADSWSWPSPVVPHALRDQAQRRLVEAACRAAAANRDFGHPIDLFLALEADLAQLGRQVSAALGLTEAIPTLAALVCAAPLDAALHDGFGLANGISSYDGYGPAFMTHDLGHTLGPAFRGRYPADYLRATPRARVPVVHLVGGLDPLQADEVDADAPSDGLPHALDDWIRRDGLTRLKVKLRGNDLAWDLERLIRVYAVAAETRSRQGWGEEIWLSADPNEQCQAPEYVIELLRRLEERCPAAFAALSYVEQPIERDLRARRLDMRPLGRIRPVIVDEGLAGPADLDLALELGWSGVALKTCKCQSLALLCYAQAIEAGLLCAVQDLTNAGLALTQAAGLAARLETINGLESNAPQFFPAASMPEAAVHPGIFRRQAGMVATASLGPLGLGHRVEAIDRPMFHSLALRDA